MLVKEYPYEKVVMLNTVYDVLDKLALPIEQVDSRKGELHFIGASGPGRIDFTALLRDGTENTRLEISEADGELSGVLLDEIQAVLQHDYVI